MKAFLTCLIFFTLSFASTAQSDKRLYELRTYYVHTGQMDALVERFQKHTTKIFERLGMQNIGYWVPIKNERNTLYYILSYPDLAARTAAWDAFAKDKEWISVSSKAKEKMVDSIVSVFMDPAQIIPKINATGNGRIFELRTYTCFPGRLPNLLTRFKDHTVGLFKNHKMESIAYFTSEEGDGIQPKLIYMIGFPTFDESTKSWAAFRKDPDWVAARDASELDGKIVSQVESVFLKPLPFSKIK
jgi:NIPSNAP